jgi:outer membrane immunogenic protein
LGGVATLAIVASLAGPANAADLPAAEYKAPAALPAPSSWTGFYAGLGLGFRASRTDATTTSITQGGVPQNLTNFVTGQPFDGTASAPRPMLV